MEAATLSNHLLRVMGIFCFVCFFFLSTCVPVLAHPPTAVERKAALTREIQTDKKIVAITFDDGPHPILTPKILDLLKKYHAKATFFVAGNKVEQFPDVLKRAHLEGHEIGNHTYDHLYGQHISSEKLQSELKKTDYLVEKNIGYIPYLYRPVGGFCNDIIMDTAENYQKTIILWSWKLDARDWQSPPAYYISSHIIQNIQPGNIVLLHDWIGTEHRESSSTVEALESILKYLDKNGYSCVTVSDLLYEAREKLPAILDPEL